MSVTFNCDTGIPNEAGSIVLLRQNSLGTFVAFEDARVTQPTPDAAASDVTFTFGPLMESDDGTVIRCNGRGDQTPSESATITVTCKLISYNIHIHVCKKEC